MKANYANILEIDELNSKPDKAEKRISELKDYSEEITQNKTQKHKEIENTERRGKRKRDIE